MSRADLNAAIRQAARRRPRSQRWETGVPEQRPGPGPDEDEERPVRMDAGAGTARPEAPVTMNALIRQGGRR